jgi:UDP-N-acetylmuramoylalanine-D-glutamate ligase
MAKTTITLDQKAKVIGVTGTNGKTSVTTLLWQCFLVELF